MFTALVPITECEAKRHNKLKVPAAVSDKGADTVSYLYITYDVVLSGNPSAWIPRPHSDTECAPNCTKRFC